MIYIQGIIYLVRAQNFSKNLHYQGVRIVSFSENFVYVLNAWSPIKVTEFSHGNNNKIYSLNHVVPRS